MDVSLDYKHMRVNGDKLALIISNNVLLKIKYKSLTPVNSLRKFAPSGYSKSLSSNLFSRVMTIFQYFGVLGDLRSGAHFDSFTNYGTRYD